MNPLALRGHTIHQTPPPGTIAVAGPYRPGTEDHMLLAVLTDFRVGGIEPILVQEAAPKRVGDFVGVTVYRRGIHVVQTITVQAQTPTTKEGQDRGATEAPHRTRQGRHPRRS